ncbi:MAG: hypothetical protein AB1502_00820 [Thermodesulfobacteriota bacterium]
MEQDPIGEVALEQAKAQEWVDLVGEEWAAPEREQVLGENVSARSAERRLPMRPEFPVLIKNAPNVG